jgi:hypothetical protein
MYFPDNRRTVKNQVRLSFNCSRANVSFAIVVEFVAQGVKLDLPTDNAQASDAHVRTPLPAGVQFHDEMGNPMTRGDGHIVPKGHNACSVNVLGVNYELFTVESVDDGQAAESHAPGGTLYFHAAAAIPPELGGKGILEDDPYHSLE